MRSLVALAARHRLAARSGLPLEQIDEIHTGRLTRRQLLVASATGLAAQADGLSAADRVRA
jgi:hypothetical protein